MIILIITRMVGCDLSYGPEAGGNTSTVENFLPLYRTMSLHHLTSNTEYWVHMVCRNIQGELHASDTVNFTTGMPGAALNSYQWSIIVHINAVYIVKLSSSWLVKPSSVELRLALILVGTPTLGWENHGEPGNPVPTKS